MNYSDAELLAHMVRCYIDNMAHPDDLPRCREVLQKVYDLRDYAEDNPNR